MVNLLLYVSRNYIEICFEENLLQRAISFCVKPAPAQLTLEGIYANYIEILFEENLLLLVIYFCVKPAPAGLIWEGICVNYIEIFLW